MVYKKKYAILHTMNKQKQKPKETKEEPKEKFTFDTVKKVINEVAALKQITNRHLVTNEMAQIDARFIGDGISRPYQATDKFDRSLRELTNNMVDDLMKEIILYNAQLAETQERMAETEIVKKAEDATDKEKKQMADIISSLGALGIQHQNAKATNSKNKANKIEQDINSVLEKTKDNPTVNVVTQMFPTIAEFEGKAERMMDSHRKQIYNVAVSYGLLSGDVRDLPNNGGEINDFIKDLRIKSRGDTGDSEKTIEGH